MKRLLGVIAALLILVSLTPCARAQEATADAAAKAGLTGLKQNYETYDLGELYVKGEKLPRHRRLPKRRW